MRILFMGTPDFAVPTLTEIVARGHEVIAVYTRAPAPAGRRGLDLVPSPVHRVAQSLGLPVATPRTLRDAQALAAIQALDVDVAVVVAYGMILPQAILDAPRLGCLNLHASLLPRWRGAAPIQRAVMAGDRETGIAVMRMEAGLDTGPVGLLERMMIGPDMTAGDLHAHMMAPGADLMVRALAALERGGLAFTPQSDTGILYAQKIEKTETRIDWSRPAQEVHDHIRGLSPFPGAWFPSGPQDTRVKVLRSSLATGSGPPGTVLDETLTIACGTGAVRLLHLQKAGKQSAGADAFLNGNPLPPGSRLT